MSIASGHRFVPFTAVGDGVWDQFVRQHPHHGPGHLSAALRLEEQQGGSIAASTAMLDEQDRVIGVCPLVDTRERQLRLLTAHLRGSGTWFPSSPLVDPGLGGRVADERMQELLRCVMDTARRDGVDRLTFSYPAVLGTKPAIETLGFFPLRRFGFSDGNRVAQLLRLDRSEEALFKGLDPKARNKVRRAESSGCSVQRIEDAHSWSKTYPLYADTLGAMAMSRETFEAVYQRFIASGDAIAVGVHGGDRMLNVVVVSIVNGAAYYWLGFSDQRDAPPGVNVLGLWHGIVAARSRGASLFELGSLDFDDGKQGRIAAFKQQFGGAPHVAFSGAVELSPGRHHAIALVSHLVGMVRLRSRRRA